MLTGVNAQGNTVFYHRETKHVLPSSGRRFIRDEFRLKTDLKINRIQKLKQSFQVGPDSWVWNSFPLQFLLRNTLKETQSLPVKQEVCCWPIHQYIHRLQIPGLFSRRIPRVQCYLPQPDLLVPGSTAVLLKFVGCSRMHSWYSLIPVNTQ